jgi:protein TonB
MAMGVALPLHRPEADLPLRRSRAKPRRQRLAGLVAALLLEALVVLALLTLGGERMAEMAQEGVPLKTFDLAAPTPEPVVAVKPPEPQVVQPRPVPSRQAAEQAPDLPTPAAPAPAAPAPAPQPSPLVQMAPGELASADLRSLPSTAKPVAKAGPPAPSTAADTPLVDGSGPNGEKLYAAAWQREPSDGELRGYLSTAQPGWGMIACRTVPDFKVDDCVAVAESGGSQLSRAMLAAAWQFRVRPPRIGGRLQVGEWVRIRFDYGVRQRAAWEKRPG